MAHIVLADHGLSFTGRTVEEHALGGAESAFTWLAEALAERGHRVEAFTSTVEPQDHRGVAWQPLAALPRGADLYVANRSSRLIGQVPGARRRALWLHNHARYLRKPRYVLPLLRHRPDLLFLSRFHLTTCAGWMPSGRRLLLPHGVASAFQSKGERPPPPPRAIFTSSPDRDLDRLLDLWQRRILPAVPTAELHLFSSAATYAGTTRAAEMGPTLERAALTPGVMINPPVARDRLAAVLAGMRLWFSPSRTEETFCLAAAEAQAMGVPVVATAVGALPERVAPGGGVLVAAEDEDGLVRAAVASLSDDAVWSAQHHAALADPVRRWADVAMDVERLLL